MSSPKSRPVPKVGKGVPFLVTKLVDDITYHHGSFIYSLPRDAHVVQCVGLFYACPRLLDH